jgi:hypothetical protein
MDTKSPQYFNQWKSVLHEKLNDIRSKLAITGKKNGWLRGVAGFVRLSLQRNVQQGLK